MKSIIIISFSLLFLGGCLSDTPKNFGYESNNKYIWESFNLDE